MTTRRSLFKSLGAGLLATALPNAAKAAVIPDDYEIDFDLLTPEDNLTFDVLEQSPNGFELEIEVWRQHETDEEGFPARRPYSGKIAWWVLPDLDAPREKALASGIAQSVVEDLDYTTRGVVRVRL